MDNIDDSFDIIEYDPKDLEELDELTPSNVHNFVKIDKFTQNLRKKYENDVYKLNSQIKYLEKEYTERVNSFNLFEEKYKRKKKELCLKLKNIDNEINNTVKDIDNSYKKYLELFELLPNFDKLSIDERNILYHKLLDYYDEKDFDFKDFFILLPKIKKYFDIIIENYIFEEHRKQLLKFLYNEKKLEKRESADYYTKFNNLPIGFTFDIIYYRYIPKNNKTKLELNKYSNISFSQTYCKIFSEDDEDIEIQTFKEDGEHYKDHNIENGEKVALRDWNILCNKDVCFCIFYVKFR